MKKFLVATLLGGTVLAGGILQAAQAANSYDVRVNVNGKKIVSDEPAYIKSEVGLTYVPVRFVSEALGAKVDWANDTQTVIIDYKGKSISINVGSTSARVDSKDVPLEAPAEKDSERTFVPLRFVSEALGADVKWDNPNRAVNITLPAAIPSGNKFSSWTPDPEHRKLADSFFSELKWDEPTQTLKVRIPQFDGYKIVASYIQPGKDQRLKNGEEYTLKLTPGTIVDIGILQEGEVSIKETYTIYSGSDDGNLSGYKLPKDLGIVVLDAKQNVVTLDAIFKGLNLKNK